MSTEQRAEADSTQQTAPDPEPQAGVPGAFRGEGVEAASREPNSELADNDGIAKKVTGLTRKEALELLGRLRLMDFIYLVGQSAARASDGMSITSVEQFPAIGIQVTVRVSKLRRRKKN